MPPFWSSAAVGMVLRSEGLDLRIVECADQQGDDGRIVDSTDRAAAVLAEGAAGKLRGAVEGRCACRAGPRDGVSWKFNPGGGQAAGVALAHAAGACMRFCSGSTCLEADLAAKTSPFQQTFGPCHGFHSLGKENPALLPMPGLSCWIKPLAPRCGSPIESR